MLGQYHGYVCISMMKNSSKHMIKDLSQHSTVSSKEVTNIFILHRETENKPDQAPKGRVLWRFPKKYNLLGFLYIHQVLA